MAHISSSAALLCSGWDDHLDLVELVLADHGCACRGRPNRPRAEAGLCAVSLIGSASAARSVVAHDVGQRDLEVGIRVPLHCRTPWSPEVTWNRSASELRRLAGAAQRLGLHEIRRNTPV